MLAMYKRQLLSVAKRVDAGSDTQRSLEKRAARIQDKIRSRAHNLFGPFDETTGFGMQRIAKSMVTGACFVLTLPVKNVARVLSDIVQYRKDVKILRLVDALRTEHSIIGKGQTQSMGDLERQNHCYCDSSGLISR